MNENTSFPDTWTQLVNLRVATKDTIKKANEEYRPDPIQRQILYGLATLIPEDIKHSGILSNPDRRKMVDHLLSFQVRLNDKMDFENAHRQETVTMAADALQEMNRVKTNLDASLHRLQAHELTETIRSTSEEVQIVEAYIASRKGTLSFDDIEKYRSIVNAINNCAVTQAILGPEYLADRLQSLPEDQMSWQAISEKYRWVLSLDPQNNVERAVIIMHNLAMAAQVDDDWYGRGIDRALGIESFATAALKENGNNHHKSKELLDGIRDSYKSGAKKLGFNAVGVEAIASLFKIIAFGMSWTTRQARHSKYPRMKNFFESKFVRKFGIREKAFGMGKI